MNNMYKLIEEVIIAEMVKKEDYKKSSEQLGKSQKEFLNSLAPQQRELFEKYDSDLQATINIMLEFYFKSGANVLQLMLK